MKETVKLGIASIIATLLISSVYVIYFYDGEAEAKNGGLEFVLSEPNYPDIVLYMNNSLKNDTRIVIHDSNGTIIFEGDYNNETLMNTSLNLNITLRQFIYLIMPTFHNNTFQYEVFEQIAKQLNEVDK